VQFANGFGVDSAKDGFGSLRHLLSALDILDFGTAVPAYGICMLSAAWSFIEI
jgi:hypothetical protein